MTEAEFTTALAQLNQLETEKAKAHQAVLASIAAARKQNEQTKALQAAMAALEPNIEQLKVATQAYVAEQRAIKHAEAVAKAKAEAEANEKKRAEEAAAKAKEASELEVAKARIAELEAAAAKG